MYILRYHDAEQCKIPVFIRDTTANLSNEYFTEQSKPATTVVMIFTNIMKITLYLNLTLTLTLDIKCP